MAIRHVKPGKELEYDDWIHRVVGAVTKYPGFRGITLLTPGGNPNARYTLYRFADQKSLDHWQNSAERKQLIREVKKYADQHFEKRSGLETWFLLPTERGVPPRWKMALSIFSGVFIVSIISRLLLADHLADWSLPASTAVYGSITVIVLTWFYMPWLSGVLRKWLYGED